jgi:hypothetical protein
MKLRNLLLAFIILTFAAALNARSQNQVTGTINGRIVSASGGAVRRASVTLMNLTTFETKVRTTNDFGYFCFSDLPIVDLYIVTVGSKRHNFSLPNQIVQFTATEHNLLFTADN